MDYPLRGVMGVGEISTPGEELIWVKGIKLKVLSVYPGRGSKGTCDTCFAEGVQVITGCTFGKGNIKKLHYGKWAVTLIDRATGRSVRVTPKAEAMLANKQSDFFKKYREKGIPASQVPEEVVEPLVQKVINAPEEAIISVGEIYTQELPPRKESFEGFVCDVCGEMTVEGYGRPQGDKKVCQPCYEKSLKK